MDTAFEGLSRLEALLTYDPPAPDPSRRVLIVGAHPDDAELSAALASLIFKRQGADVHSVSVSPGNLRGDKGCRLAEWEEASRTIGYTSAAVLDYCDGRIGDSITSLVDDLEQIHEIVKPDIVISHSDRDTHQDHRAVHDAIAIAYRNGPSLWEMHSPSTSAAQFQPHIFVSTQDHDLAFRAVAAIGAYRSQADIASPIATLSKYAIVGRHAKTKQEVGFPDPELAARLADGDPLSLREQSSGAPLEHVYLGVLAAYPPGTVFAEEFEPNCIRYEA